MFESIDFSPGIINFNQYQVNEKTNLNEENDDLQEDMFLVVFPNNYAIDVGWYLGTQCFLVFVVKDYNWDEPIKKRECFSYAELESTVMELTKWLKELQ
ncbi:hypothetical protein [Paenibacillus sp. SI8]|uniref:hypothetical protein n=1 Tax=unclassified Paenibacillus TaxID=185978 RepID=UPI003465FA03